MRREMTDATTLTPGAKLTSKWDETLVLTDRTDDDELVFEIDGDYTETYTIAGVQESLDDGVMELADTSGANTQDDTDAHEPETVADIDPSNVDDADLYIRFGNIPSDERSYDNRNNTQEDGVSVYDCERASTDDDAPENVDEAYYLKGTMLQTVFGLMTRDTYLVTGDQVGTGADGEPVLRDVEVVANLRTPEGVGGWITTEDN